jgi:hypothetical protein
MAPIPPGRTPILVWSSLNGLDFLGERDVSREWKREEW